MPEVIKINTEFGQEEIVKINREFDEPDVVKTDKEFDRQSVIKLDREFDEEPDQLEGSLLRKPAIVAKTLGDIWFAPIGGTKGLVERQRKQEEKNPTLKFLNTRRTTPEERRQVQDAIVNVRPRTPVEHTASAVAQFYGFGKIMKPISAVFGLGKEMSLAQKVIRGAAAGGVLGAAPKGTPEDRLIQGAVGAATFGAFTAGGAILQERLAKYSQQQLVQSLARTDTTLRAIQEGLKTRGGASNAKVYQQLLNEIPAKDRNVVLNILKSKYNMPQKAYRNWYQKNVGDPVWNKTITKLQKITPDWLKDKLVYRWDSPEFLTDMYEQRNVNIAKWNELAERSGNLMVEGVSEAESKIMLRALREPTQLEILKTMNPNLASRVIQVRNNISNTSREVIEQINRKAKLTDRSLIKKNAIDLSKTIEKNLDTYVKRIYERPPDLRRRFFVGRSPVSDPKVFERGKIARELYEKDLNKKISIATKNFEKAGSVKNVSGVGKVTESKLKLRGIRNVEDLSLMDTEELANILLIEQKNKLNSAAKRTAIAIDKIDDEIKELSKLNFRTMEGVSPTRRRIVSRIKQLDRARRRLKTILEKESSQKYNEALTKATGLKQEAGQFAGKRRGLNAKINEYNNLIDTPLKEPDIPYDIQKRLKVIETGGAPVARSIRDTGLKVENNRFFNDIASDPRLASNNPATANRGWVKMKDTPSKGALRNMWVHPSVDKDINTIEKIFSQQDKLYSKLLGLWKAGKVTLNPATHGRNIISNSILLEMSGTSAHKHPALLSAAIGDIKNQSFLYKNLKAIGLGRGTFTQAEIGNLEKFYSQNNSLGGLLSKAKTTLKPFKSLTKLYELEEEVFKIAKVRDLLSQGFTVDNAFKEAQKWLFNYDQIPNFIRSVRQSPIGAPFITFQYKATPRIFEALVKNPTSLAKYPLVFRGLEELARKKFGLSDTDVAILKKDQPLSYVLPFTDENDQFRLFNLQYILPYGQFFEVTDRGISGAGLGGNPLFSVPYNVFVSNRDPYTGKDIIDKNSNLYRKWRDRMKFVANSALPPLTPYLGYSANQIGKALQSIPLTKYGERPDYVLEVFGAVAGLRTVPRTIPTSQIRAINRINFLKISGERAANRAMKDQSLTEKQRQDTIREIYTDMINNIMKETKIFGE